MTELDTLRQIHTVLKTARDEAAQNYAERTFDGEGACTLGQLEEARTAWFNADSSYKAWLVDNAQLMHDLEEALAKGVVI